MIVGQKYLVKVFRDMVSQNVFPRFSMIVGQRGCGKKTLAKFVANEMGATYVSIEGNMDGINEMIEMAHFVDKKIVFVIVDADSMSINAKNALLKITEEPPKNSYIIITCENEVSMLDTIRSRAFVFKTLYYSQDDLNAYAKEKGYNKPPAVCETPGDVDLFNNAKGKEMLEYARVVCCNIDKVHTSNSFRIGDKIALKDEPDKYDLRFFLKCVIYQASKMEEECIKRYKGGEKFNVAKFDLSHKIIKESSKLLSDIRLNSTYNKQTLFDMWIFAIRDGLCKI